MTAFQMNEHIEGGMTATCKSLIFFVCTLLLVKCGSNDATSREQQLSMTQAIVLLGRLQTTLPIHL